MRDTAFERPVKHMSKTEVLEMVDNLTQAGNQSGDKTSVRRRPQTAPNGLPIPSEVNHVKGTSLVQFGMFGL